MFSALDGANNNVGRQESKPEPADNVAHTHHPGTCPKSGPDDSACCLYDKLIFIATIDGLQLPGDSVGTMVYVVIDCIHLYPFTFTVFIDYAEPLDLSSEAKTAV
jgi:hypothetical protein